MEEGLIEFGSSNCVDTSAPPRRSRRSKGCVTCRKRKVKCDEARPFCERCRNGVHKCLGYDETRVFVNSGPGLENRKSPSAQSRSSSATPEQQPQQAYPIRSSPESTVSLQSSSASPGAYTVQELSAFSSVPDLRILPTLKLDGFRNGIVISHLLLKFQVIVAGNTPGATDAPSFAALFLSGDCQSTPYIAGLSVAEALFGRVHCDEELIQHSAILYGRSLKRLQRDIQNIEEDEARARSYMNLWTSTFLGVYELMTASNPMGWLEHARGLAALTQSLGPEAFQEASARKLFYSNRLFIATAGIATGKRTFLEQYEWKTVPWELDPTLRPINILLQDIFCDLPGLMEDVHRIGPTVVEGGRTQELSVLQAKIINAYVETELLRWSWEEEYPNVCWEVPETRTVLESPSTGSVWSLFTTVLHFESFERAVDAMYFNVIRLFLYSLAEDIGLSPEALLHKLTVETKCGPFANALVPPGQGDMEGYALDICRSVEYMIQGDQDSLGALSLMFPLRIASDFLKNRPDMMEWLRWVLSELAARKGFKLGEHVMSMGGRD